MLHKIAIHKYSLYSIRCTHNTFTRRAHHVHTIVVPHGFYGNLFAEFSLLLV